MSMSRLHPVAGFADRVCAAMQCRRIRAKEIKSFRGFRGAVYVGLYGAGYYGRGTGDGNMAV